MPMPHSGDIQRGQHSQTDDKREQPMHPTDLEHIRKENTKAKEKENPNPSKDRLLTFPKNALLRQQMENRCFAFNEWLQRFLDQPSPRLRVKRIYRKTEAVRVEDGREGELQVHCPSLHQQPKTCGLRLLADQVDNRTDPN